MSSPEFSSVPPLPDYMAPFDSEHPAPDYPERLQATAILRAAVEQKKLEILNSSIPASSYSDLWHDLLLDSVDIHDDPVVLSIESENPLDHPDLQKYIVLLMEGPKYTSGNYMRRHDYFIPRQYSDDGTTRRDDRLADASTFPAPTTPSDVLSLVDPKLLQGILDKLEASDIAEQFQRQTGLNFQPIGVSEAQAIALIISLGQAGKSN